MQFRRLGIDFRWIWRMVDMCISTYGYISGCIQKTQK